MTAPTRGEAALREQAVAAVRRLDELGLNRGSTGNLSLRCTREGRSGMLVTPTGMGADSLRAQDMVWVGDDGSVAGEWMPSSEWLFHQAVLQRRADLHAVVHAHSVHATALACLERPLPAFHYMVAVAGGDSIRCSPYALFGSQALAGQAVAALRERRACLLGNHGQIAIGDSLESALALAIEVEELAAQYGAALAIGEPRLLDGAQMREVIERFAGYGQPQRRDEP
jgi:L-fuculose-phosphate aldolase